MPLHHLLLQCQFWRYSQQEELRRKITVTRSPSWMVDNIGTPAKITLLPDEISLGHCILLQSNYVNCQHLYNVTFVIVPQRGNKFQNRIRVRLRHHYFWYGRKGNKDHPLRFPRLTRGEMDQ